ncbi:hypothetical protein V1477_015607 [Vespula maculifrons]|uniref:Uncharacterized protein n=1 Tax=Vespula maculifrons TaxID=7453 RepID=A0ABD2BEI2_VESMC
MNFFDFQVVSPWTTSDFSSSRWLVLSEFNTTGRVSRYLKLTVWTVAFFVSKVSFVSSFLIGRYLPKRKDISNANFRVESPLARGSPNAATSSWWDLVSGGTFGCVAVSLGDRRRIILLPYADDRENTDARDSRCNTDATQTQPRWDPHVTQTQPRCSYLHVVEPGPTQMQSRDTRFRETTTKSGPGPTFKVTSSVVLWTSTRELRNFRRCHPCKY